MSTTCSKGRIWRRRVPVVIVAALSLVASMGLPATAAKPATSGGGGNGVATPKLTAVVSLSQHRVLATYDRDLDGAALQASSYVINSTEAVNLRVTGVSRASNNQVFVTTAAQEPVTYVVKKPKTSRPVTFTGSVVTEPTLVSAKAVSSTQIVLLFSEPMGAGADQPSSYTITVAGTTQVLPVTSATASGNQVILTTAPQEPVSYLLEVGDIQSLVGVFLNPTATSVELSGTTIPAGPMLVGAVPQGDSGLLLTFGTALDPSAADPANYSVTPSIAVTGATLLSGDTQVLLETGTLFLGTYTIVVDVVGADGSAINPNFSSASFTGSVVPDPEPPPDTERPVVSSAGSANNTTVVVQFSEAMADNALDTSHYAIVQENVNPEVGALPVTAAEFVDEARQSVRLTTRSQNEVTYRVTANNITDLAGNPLAGKTIVGGVLLADPTSFVFPGTPPSGAELVDADGDTLYDNQEYLGWQVLVSLANGTSLTRQVSSNPDASDTDGDGLTDDVEKALNADPRDNDTDDDQLSDYTEFNEIFSDPSVQDSDGDGLYDGLEVTTFLTSPIFDDTDGDQLKDADEINVNRNARVADLPAPVLRIGETSMGLDVRFTESNGETTRELDSKTVEATLVQSESQEFSRSEGSTHEVSAKLAQDFGVSLTAGCSGFLCSSFDFSSTFSYNRATEETNTDSWTSSFSESSSQATEQAHTDSLTTEEEVSVDSTVTRTIDGATMKVAVFLESAGNVAFTAKNLQVAALIADPADPTRLTPVATLLPEGDPATEFNLGPLVPPKGPIVFSNSDIFPQLVDDLMRNPRGLVFRFSNYDIVDEAGRNFAFTSQEVNDRTARVAIDFGGFDPNGDGLGEGTEILRVATGVIGRRVIDTNDDGVVDDDDRPVVFDLDGNQVGISLRDALRAAGLDEYDEAVTPSSSLSAADRQSSYSVLKSTNGTDERLFRIRGREIEEGSPKSWEILSATGIDRTLSLDEHVLFPGTSITLSFLEDLDQDEMPAVMEAMHNCIDSPTLDASGDRFLHRDTDSDGLDDRFEVMVGWQVDVPGRGIRQVGSGCATADSDSDGLSDRAEAPGIINYNDAGLVLFDRGVDPWIQANAPRRDTSATADSSLGWALTDPITDPTRIDTDADSLPDGFELTPYQNQLKPPNPPGTLTPLQATSAEHSDSDGDGVSDGLEQTLGGDPRVADLANLVDTDRDGLVDGLESLSYPVRFRQMTSREESLDLVCVLVCDVQTNFDFEGGADSLPSVADSDGDGLGDAEERDLELHPRRSDTDEDGLTDFEEVRGFELRDLGVITTDPLNQDTDNDKRTDGEEAGRSRPWVVTVWLPDRAPFEVFTDPLRSDTDLDGLLDGDEQTFLSDPTNFNTDGDPRRDVTEVFGETRTNVPDLHVEVQFGSISVIQAGDGAEDDPGEISWSLTAHGSMTSVGAFGSAVAKAGGLISMGPVTVSLGSVSTSETVWEEISITDTVSEKDDALTDCKVDMAAIALPEGDEPAIIAGRDITPGIRSWPLHRRVTCASGFVFEFTLNLALLAR